jgi:hypothetical protein
MKRGVLVVSAFVACGGEVHTTPIGQIPSEPSGPTTTSTDVSTLAIDALFVGDTDFAGTASSAAWKSFGYDLDGIATTDKSTNVCNMTNGPVMQADGLGGIDNEWGSYFLWEAQLAVGGGFFGPQTSDGSIFAWASPSTDATSFIRSGAWTLEIVVKGLTDPFQTAIGLDAQVFVGGAQDGASFDGGTSWPVAPTSLADGETIEGGARVHFGTTYVTEGTVVAKDSSEPLVVPLVFHNGGEQLCMLGGCSDPSPQPVPVPLTLRIHHPIITFERSDPSSLAKGIIAGVLDPQELTDAVMLAFDLGPVGCTGMARAGLSATVHSMADILHDGTNASGVPCDAISIGLGFTAKRIANATMVGADTPVPADPCTN